MHHGVRQWLLMLMVDYIPWCHDVAGGMARAVQAEEAWQGQHLPGHMGDQAMAAPTTRNKGWQLSQVGSRSGSLHSNRAVYVNPHESERSVAAPIGRSKRWQPTLLGTG